MPAVAVLSGAAVVVSLATHMIRASSEASAPVRPDELVGPRLNGQDEKQRPFVITATNAVRDQNSLQRIRLKNPVLVRSQGRPDELRVTAATGVYDENAGRLELSGKVALAGTQGDFTTPSAVYDTRRGELVGQGGIQAKSPTGQLQAGSFEVKDGGKSVVYKGGVRTRINPR